MGELKLKEWMLMIEFAEEARISLTAVKRRIAEGNIKASKPGRQVVIHRSELEKFMKRTQIKT